jgi:hypothetical protein
LGGAIFLMEGATLTVSGNLNQSVGVASPRSGSLAAGSAMFLQGNGTLAFAPASGKTVAIADQIADEAGTGAPVVAANGRPSLTWAAAPGCGA